MIFCSRREGLQFMAKSPEHELLQEGRISSAGTSLSPEEIEALVVERFPRKAYCTVEDWLTSVTSILTPSLG